MHARIRQSNFCKRALPPCALIFCCAFVAATSFAEALDDQVALDEFLGQLVNSLDELSIDVTMNVNSRELGRGRPNSPRLGGFWDIPVGLFPTAQEIGYWEEDLSLDRIGALAVILCEDCDAPASDDDFLEQWLRMPDSHRVLVSFDVANEAVAAKIAAAARSAGLIVQVLPSENALALAGELYATAGRRLVVDSRESRRLDSNVTEFMYLGERSRRGSESIFQKSDSSRGLGLAKNEPSVFLKETLGDEFNQSTIEEIIVPGGVALGETARLDLAPVSMAFDGERLLLLDDSGTSRHLPHQALTVSRALFDFVERSSLINSDAIVDIDENARVSISSALRDTDVGYDIMHADTQPFEYISNLPVTKSVVIDTYVKWMPNAESSFSFDTEFEVRFLSADNMRIAQTRAALVFQYDSANEQVSYRDAWGREARRLNEKVDYAGLGDSMQKVAHYAGWIALFRKLKEDNVPFLRGRYQFMKLDNQGRVTPIRY